MRQYKKIEFVKKITKHFNINIFNITMPSTKAKNCGLYDAIAN